MEDARIEAPKLVESKLLFPPHRRLSETYRTLVRILSPFYDNTDVSLATEFDPQQLRAAYSNHLRQATVESSGQQVVEDFVRVETGDPAIEKVTVVEDGLGINSLKEACFHNSEVKMDVIKDMTIVERSDNVSDQRKTSEASSQDNHCVHEQNHRDELEAEHIVEGNKVLVDDNSCNNVSTSDQTNGGNDQISPKKFQEDIAEHQVMAEEDVVSIVQELSGTVFSLDGHRIGEASKPKEDNQENIFSIVDKGMQQWPENRPKEPESESNKFQEDIAEQQQVMAEENVVSIVQELSGTVFSLDGHRIGEASKPKEDNQENILSIVDKGMQQWPENRPKEPESENNKFQEDIAEHQQVMAEEDVVSIVQELSGTVFSLDGHRIGEASKPKEDNQENILSIVDKGIQQWPENRPKEPGSENNKFQEDIAEHQQVMAEKDVVTIVQKLSGTAFLLDGHRIGEVSKPKEDNQENILSIVDKGMQQWPENRPKEPESENNKFQEDIAEHQQVMAEEDVVTIVQKLSGTVFSIDGHRIGEVSKPKEDNQENILSMVDKSMQQSPENRPKELESKSNKFQEDIAEHQQIMAEEDVVTIVQKLSGTVFSLDGHRIGEVSKPKEDNQENILSIVDKGMQQSPENRPKESKSIVCEPDLEIGRSNVSSFEVLEVEDSEQCSENVSGVDLSYMDKEIPCWAYEQSKNSEDKTITMEVDTSEVKHKMLSEAMKTDKFMIENEDMEEGEICGDSTYEISEDPVVLAEKVVDMQIFEETMNRSKLPLIQANGEANKPDSLFSDIAEHASHENIDESRKNKSSMDARKCRSIISEKIVASTNEDQNDFMSEERGYTVKDNGTKKDVDSFTARVSNQVLHGQVPNEHATGGKEILSTEKETEAHNKKKRGPLSEGRKERKKIQKRKKRAEENRKHGVKRLKLHPVTVPKPVVYCRHYIKGRCHEGDKCKFSHDTTPLTKSTPCNYFARHSCMKGGDCPFDHQLSKYPCNNFVSNGSCHRGDTCMFSHEILPQEESTGTPNLKTEFKPPVIPDSLDSQKKSNISGGLKQNLVTVPNYTGTSCNRTPQGGTLPKKMAGPPPVGINFLSFGKSPDHSSQVKNDNVECKNVLARSGLCPVENSNEISRKIQPNTAPKGINFLSFGRTSLKSNSEKLATPSSYDDETNSSGNQLQVVPKTGHDSNELLKKVQMTTPKQTNFSFPLGNYASNELVSSSSNLKAGSDLFVQIKGSTYDKHEGLSAISRLPSTPISSGQFSDSLASRMNKGTPNSAQKALLSTLAFAAKSDSFMNKGKSSASPAVSNEGNKEGGIENISGSLKNNQAKASKLLDFLLGIGSKSNL